MENSCNGINFRFDIVQNCYKREINVKQSSYEDGKKINEISIDLPTNHLRDDKICIVVCIKAFIAIKRLVFKRALSIKAKSYESKEGIEILWKAIAGQLIQISKFWTC